jgi:HicB family
MRRRKPDTWVQVNLRIKETLRAELAAAAKEHEVSFNQEVRARLADSLEQKARQSLESLASNLEHKARDIELAWRRFDDLVQRSEPPLPLREAEAQQQPKKERGKK